MTPIGNSSSTMRKASRVNAGKADIDGVCRTKVPVSRYSRSALLSATVQFACGISGIGVSPLPMKRWKLPYLDWAYTQLECLGCVLRLCSCFDVSEQFWPSQAFSLSLIHI